MPAATPFVVEAFHGTRKAFDRFVPSERGSFGAGIYFGSTLQQGVIFSGEDEDSSVLRVQLTLRRPYRYRVVEPEVVDCWGEGLVNDIFPAHVAPRLVEAALNADGQFGAEIREQLEALDHDGVVAIFEDGTQEILALYPSQCEILERMTLDEVYARHPELFGSPAALQQESCG